MLAMLAVGSGALALPLAENLGVVIGGPLHLRDAPSLHATVLATYDSGTHVQVTGVDGVWYKVQVIDGAVGYMEAAHIYVTNRGVVVNGQSFVNLRSEPSRNAKVIGEYPTGTVVTLLSENTKGWCFVDINGVEGYMAASFIKAAPQDSSSQQITSSAVFRQEENNPYASTRAESAAIRQIGEEQIDEHEGEALSYTVRYPLLGIDTADKAIRAWVDSAIAEAEQTAAAMEEGALLELSVDYDAYLVAGRYIGVLESGHVMGMSFAHPWDTVFVVNVDGQTGETMDLGQIIAQGRMSDVAGKLDAKLAALDGNPVAGLTVNESWLKYALLTTEGVAFILPRGEYIPAVWGTQEIVIPYEELAAEGLLAIDMQGELEAVEAVG